MINSLKPSNSQNGNISEAHTNPKSNLCFIDISSIWMRKFIFFRNIEFKLHQVKIVSDIAFVLFLIYFKK